MDKARKVLRYMAKPLVLKVVHRPLGIWLAWACLVYAVWALTPARTLSRVMVVWPIILLAVITLIRRRLIARTFVSIVIAFMLVHAIHHIQIWGICLGVLGFFGLLANRRWFYETLPNVE